MELESKPICAIAISRHGARTPSIMPKYEESFWREQLSTFEGHEKIHSQLTLKGENDMKELGKKLHASYSHLIRDDQVMQNCRFYSTDYDRTKQSAHLVALEFGAADPLTAVKFCNGQVDPLDPWVSIPEFPPKVSQFCRENSVFLQELKRVDALKSRLIDTIFKDHFSTREFTWIDAYDVCFCASSNASAPNHEVASQLVREVTETVTRQFNYMYFDSEIRKLAVGGLFGGLYNWFSIKSNFKFSLKENPPPLHVVDIDASANFAFICCHDVNLLPLMAGLNWTVDSDEPFIAWPEFGFHIVFELMEDLRVVRIRDSRGKQKDMPIGDFLSLCAKESL